MEKGRVGPFTAVYEEAEEGGYIAYVEEMAGVNTQGETLDEARENLKDALALFIRTSRDTVEKEIAGHKVIKEKIAVAI